MLLDLFYLEFYAYLNPPVTTGAGDDNGDGDKKRLKAKIKWLERQKKLREKDRRVLALYKHQLEKLEPRNEPQDLLPKIKASKPPLSLLQPLVPSPVRQRLPDALQIKFDILGEDDELDELLFLAGEAMLEDAEEYAQELTDDELEELLILGDA